MLFYIFYLLSLTFCACKYYFFARRFSQICTHARCLEGTLIGMVFCYNYSIVDSKSHFSMLLYFYMYLFKVVAKGMIDRASPGSIVNVSSQASSRALKDHTVYCSTKGALDQLTRVMALELGPHKVSFLQCLFFDVFE